MRFVPRRVPGARAAAAGLALSAAIAGTALAGGPAGAALAAGPRSAAPAPAAHRLTAVIRRTAGGTPHIQGRTWADAGFGYGYAFAQDNLCTMANDYVTVQGRRSRYFGPAATYQERGDGTTVTNLESDLFWRQVAASGVLKRAVAGLDPRARQLEAGYVAGYNRYLARVGGARGVPDPACRGRAWVAPITLRDSELRFYQLMLENGQDAFIDAIGSAQPPKPGAIPAAEPAALARPAAAAATLARRWRAVFGSSGSNAVAIGSAGSRGHHGLLLGNPHFPWLGTERFYQAQLTIPGQLNVTGAALFGVPLILIGHTATVAWSHTVSTAIRFTPYQLTLVAGHPTRYLVDGRQVAMTRRAITVTVRRPDGHLARLTRTLYGTRYGPVFNNLLGLSVPWTTSTAFALDDANATNLSRAMNTWLGFDTASTTRQILTILRRYQGIPWVNTIASDKWGQALYADIGTIPGVSNALARRCDTPLGVQTFAQVSLPVLDGAKTSCAWQTGRRAAAPGLFGPGQEPFLLRRDYVTNSNDSYWLSNPNQPLTGFPAVIGDTGTPRSLRTRIGLVEVQARVNGTDGLGPAGFTLRQLQNLDLSDRDYAAQLTRAAWVRLCRQLQAAGHGAPTPGGGHVAIGPACSILARWNQRWDTGSPGAVLFGTTWADASSGSASPWSHPFQAAHPVTTPNGLNTSATVVRDALGAAISQLRKAGVPLDATIGSVQFVPDHGQRIPIPGGPGDTDGIYNVIGGNPPIGGTPTFGSSFIQAVTWNNSRCPVGATILTYSESTSPVSSRHFDQTKLFSRKQWLPDRFCAGQIARAPGLTVTRVTS
jgi:acyl-homoserine-lactone acylase